MHGLFTNLAAINKTVIGGQNRLTISTSGPDFRNSKGVVRLALNRKGEEVVVALEPPASGTTKIMISLVGKHFLMENSITYFLYDLTE